jgi:tetratricopeptide (TPR) repeat protein
MSARRLLLVAACAALAAVPPAAHAGPGSAADAPPGARAAAMGGAFTALADDGNALWWNPAGIARLGHQEFTSTLGDLYGSGVGENHLGYVFPITDRHAAAVSWKQAALDDAGLEFAENTFSLGYALRFGKKFGAGLAYRHLQSTVDLDGSTFTEWSGNTLDVGLQYAASDRLTVGASLKDAFGRTVQHQDGPSERLADPQLTLGVAGRPLGETPWTLAADVNDRLHLGTEYWHRGLIGVQAGAMRDLATTQGADPEGWTWSLGAGARWKILQFDYAHVMPPVLPATNRFTAAVAFNLNPSRVRVEKAQMDEVYASQKGRYASRPVGVVKLTSRVEEPQAATLSVFVPGLMSAPTEREVVVRPKSTQDVPMSAVFGNELLALQEDRAVTADVRLTYRHKNRTRVERATTQLFVYRPGAISWEDTRAAAAFVTPSDPVVAEFARAVVAGRDQAFEGGPLRNVMTAMRMWSALSGYGLTYVPDPNTPFSAVSATRNAVDQVQYPRGLLASRTGDCDDMSVLFCAMLENVGIPTAFLDGPGHILMMFDAGVHPRNALALSMDEASYVVKDERVWIPIETTMIGKGFMDAWEEGAAIYRRWEPSAEFHVVPVVEAWAEYVPSLPESPPPTVAPPSAEAIDARFAVDVDSLRARQASYLRSRFHEQLEPDAKSGLDAAQENRLALVHALDGRFAEARAGWAKVLAANAADAAALVNTGNLDLLSGRADSALVRYDAVLALERDPGVLLNQGLARWSRGDEAGADASFGAALALLADPAEAERLLGLPQAAAGQGSPRRLTVEEVRQRLRLAAARVPNPDADPASGTPTRGGVRPVRVVSKVSGARATDRSDLAQVVYWKGLERGSR